MYPSGAGARTVPTEEQEEVDDQEKEWRQVNQKVEELADQIVRQFDDANEQSGRTPQIIKAPPQPTTAEFEQHQATHTPYAAWCRHCAAARAIRRQHPKKGRGAIIVPDVESGIDGPIKVSIDYMYLHERSGRDQEAKHNPPYLVMVEHRHGRC